MKPDLSHKFKTPDGFFDKMQEEILSKSDVNTQSSKVIPFYQSPIFQMAAVLVGTLLVSLTAWQISLDSITPEDEITAKEVIYDTYFIEDFEENTYQLDAEPLYAEFVELQTE